jgi:hypothetical protein
VRRHSKTVAESRYVGAYPVAWSISAWIERGVVQIRLGVTRYLLSGLTQCCTEPTRYPQYFFVESFPSAAFCDNERSRPRIIRTFLPSGETTKFVINLPA